MWDEVHKCWIGRAMDAGFTIPAFVWNYWEKWWIFRIRWYHDRYSKHVSPRLRATVTDLEDYVGQILESKLLRTASLMPGVGSYTVRTWIMSVWKWLSRWWTQVGRFSPVTEKIAAWKFGTPPVMRVQLPRTDPLNQCLWQFSLQ
jgi:hypothetical protein